MPDEKTPKKSKMTLYEIFSLVLQFIATFSFVIALVTFKYAYKKDIQHEAPNFIISSVIYLAGAMSFPDGVYKDPDNSTFVFQKRRVLLNFEGEELSAPIACLIVNVRRNYKDD